MFEWYIQYKWWSKRPGKKKKTKNNKFLILFTKRIYMYIKSGYHGVWNFSAVLQNVFFYNSNVFCLCKIVYVCHMFLMFFCVCICPCNSLEINKLQKIYIENMIVWFFDFWCFNATFNNISAISWRPVLVVEEAGVPGENHRSWASNW